MGKTFFRIFHGVAAIFFILLAVWVFYIVSDPRIRTIALAGIVILGLAYVLSFYRKSEDRIRQESSDIDEQPGTADIAALTTVVRQLVNILPSVVEDLSRDRFNIRTVALAIIYDENDEMILYKLPRGEYKDQLQFIGGYSLPLRDPRPKAEEEIMRELNLRSTQLQYIGCPTEDRALVYKHSNLGTNFAHIYEYRISNRLLEKLLKEKGALCRRIDFSQIEYLKFDTPVALYVYDFLEQYKKVEYSSVFSEELEFRREERIKENER
ncbi:MAG TPA: hypothetical protein VLY03_06840, partial [Bacteroidota bacterium]|nr:hypothetical protein [Bacteroidota bacterium]